MKYNFKTPPSSTEQNVDVNIDLVGDRIVATHDIQGTTSIPIITPPTPVEPETPPVDGYEVIYNNTFDTLKNLTDNNEQYGNGKVVNGKFYSVPANISGGVRSELQLTYAQTPTEGAVEWDAMYEFIKANNGHSFQFHPRTEQASASPGLWHINGKFVWNNWITPPSGVKDGYNVPYPTNQTIPQGKWNRYRLEYKFGKTGYLRFFINGAKVMDKSNIQVGDGSAAYIKCGWNGWGSGAENSRIWYDNLTVFKKV